MKKFKLKLTIETRDVFLYKSPDELELIIRYCYPDNINEFIKFHERNLKV